MAEQILCKFCGEEADEDTHESRKFTNDHGCCRYCYCSEKYCQICLSDIPKQSIYSDVCDNCERSTCENCAAFSQVQNPGMCRECFIKHRYEFYCPDCKNVVESPKLPALIDDAMCDKDLRYCETCKEKKSLHIWCQEWGKDRD